MQDFIAVISSIFGAIGQIILVLWKILSFLLKKVWVFIVAIFSAIIALFIVKKVNDKDGEVKT